MFNKASSATSGPSSTALLGRDSDLGVGEKMEFQVGRCNVSILITVVALTTITIITNYSLLFCA